MLKKIVTEKLLESSLSMKAWFVVGERNRLKSAINLPLKAKREDCLVEGGNDFLETSKKNWWRKLLISMRNITMFHVN